MLSALVSLSLLVTSVVCVPILSPPQGTGITVYVPDPNNPGSLKPVTTLSPLKKRQDVTVVEYIQNDPNDPNNITPLTTYIQNGPTQTPIPQAQPQPEPEPVPDTTTHTSTSNTGSTDQGSSSTDGSPLSAGDSMLTDINYWRNAYGKTALTWSNELADAALNTGTLDGGSSAKEVHHNAQNAAEVIAPGSDNSMGKDLQGHSPFEISYISWLCEVPDGQRLGNLCQFQQDIMWT